MEHQYLKNIEKGLRVEILTEGYKLKTGNIRRIMTTEKFHTHGIKVELNDGSIGRIQKIIRTSEEIKSKEQIALETIISKGETGYTEFKQSTLWSINITKEDIKKSRSLEVHHYKQKASKVIIAKSICAFLNTNGGNLLIGIKETKGDEEKIEIVGIDNEYKKLRDHSKDGYKRMLIDEVIKPYFPSQIFNHLNQYLEIKFIELEEKTICWIKINKSDRRVFLTVNEKELFYIRVDSENRILEGEKLVEYCLRNWKTNL